MNKYFLAIVVWGVFLPSCMTVGKDYVKPYTVTPEGYSMKGEMVGENAPSDPWTLAVLADNEDPIGGSAMWWEQFGDDTLTKLILRARKANHNIYIARKRISENWHQRGVIASYLYPEVKFQGRDEYGIAEYDTDKVDVEISRTYYENHQMIYGWELDVFGKIKRQVESLEAGYDAKIEGWRDAMAFISGEVAISYIAYRTLERRLEVADLSKEIFFEIKDRMEKRRALGVASDMELAEATARFKTSAALVPQLEQERLVVRNRIAFLTGGDVLKVQALLDKGSGVPTPPKKIMTGVPADLLRSRPDVRRAERNMASRTALVNVAIGNLYPTFTISGILKYEHLLGSSVDDVLDRVVTIGSTTRWRLLNGNSDSHRIMEQEAFLDQAVGEYRRVVAQAVVDVEDAMARLHYTKKRLGLLSDAREAHFKTGELMNDAYDAGEVELRRLLNAQLDYIQTLDEETATEGRWAAHSVRLFRALGGGELSGVPQQYKHYKSTGRRGFWSFLPWGREKDQAIQPDRIMRP